MTFQPIVPLSGYTGWRFLQRTLENQQSAFQQSAPVARATDYFRENIGKVTTAEDLVNDRRLLTVALGAFGLDDDIDNRYFIQKILADGTVDSDALANRLSDNRYATFSQTFGFGDFGIPLTTLPRVVDDIIARFEARQFERAVGDQNNDMRLALNLGTGLQDIIDNTQNADARWFSIMGNQPLREVVQTALGLPAAIARIDLDQQLTAFKDRAQSVLGTADIGAFTAPDLQEKMIRLFLVRSEAANATAASGGSIALTLLQSISA